MVTGATEAGDRTIGAYGVRIVGVEGPEGGPGGDPSWPVWSVRQVTGAVDFEHGVRFRAQGARIGLGGGAGIEIDRETRTITYTLREPVSADALLHPGLVPAMAVVAVWDGRASLHCSALLVNGRVWALLADREGGKSTTAALLVERGCQLFTDDMLILEGGTAFAGPGSIDLRPAAAGTLGGQSLGRIGERERWRKRVPVPVAVAPLAGLVVLDWGESVRVEELDAGARLTQLDRHLSLPVTGEHLLGLADHPMLRFTRPRDLSRARASADALLARLER